MSVRVRFVLSGACHPSYSGRQMQLEVPLVQANGNPTTTADIKEMIRKNWPIDLPEMRDTINSTDMKILRTGNLLADETQLQNILSPAETYDCSVSSAAPRDGEEPKSVLMHLVFQKNQTTTKREKESSKLYTGKKKDSGPRDNSCCCTM
ncbi:UBL3-like [Trypanosoma melophagium]|uniref:UBL3-like n=1 Tax=Trypanosoma melophagium TaxID=715481 RepID=UPI00351A5A0C|nr:UBL3-like [Trypanosoma melophagium]